MAAGVLTQLVVTVDEGTHQLEEDGALKAAQRMRVPALTRAQ